MLSIKLNFTIDEAINLFRNAGLNVCMQHTSVYFKRSHGEGLMEDIPVWMVQDPNSGTYVSLKELFDMYMEIKKEMLFLKPEKLEIYNLFQKLA